MVIYVARHGQTPWNLEHKLCGRTDIELTEEGLRQARQLARLAEGKSISMILSSPLRRAKDTAQSAADLLGLKVQTDNRLLEWNYGAYEGTNSRDPAFQQAKQQFANRLPQGESLLEVVGRVYSLLNQLKEQHMSHNLLMVTHGDICRVIHSYFLNLSIEEFFSYTHQNGQLEVYCLGE